MHTVMLKVNNRTGAHSVIVDGHELENCLGARTTVNAQGKAVLELLMLPAMVEIDGELEVVKAVICPDCEKSMLKMTYLRGDNKLGTCWACECEPHDSYPGLEYICRE